MSTATIDLTGRPVGRTGFNLELLKLELRRTMRNRRVVVFTLLFPVVMLLSVNATIPADQQSMGPGVVANVGAYVMVSMALYGVAMAATSGGAAVSIERASGWSRQMRLTPLNPVSFVLLKIATAFALGMVAMLATYVLGDAMGIATMALQTWVETAVVILAGSFVFAAFGLFMGYLIPSENVMQFVGPILAVLGFLGGLFQGPISTASVMGKIQSATPIYGLSQVAHWPLTLTTHGSYDSFNWWWVVNLLVWAVIFVAGAVWRFRKDTSRV